MRYTMLNMKAEMDSGSVVRYKDFVVVAEFLCGPSDEFFEVRVYYPTEDPNETTEDFWNLWLDEIAAPDLKFDTEGEALMEGFKICEGCIFDSKRWS